MLREQSRDLTTKTSLDPQNPSRLKCGCPRKRRNKKESVKKTGKQNKFFLHSWVSLLTSTRVVTEVAKTTSIRVDISSATPTIKAAEVANAVAEVAEEVAETTLREIRVRMVVSHILNHPSFLFLRLTS